MESRTLRYRTNVPFCNACSEERDSHCKVILILKLAYRTNFSLVGSYFSLEIFLQDHRKIVNIQTSHEKCNDRYTANKRTFCQEKWNDKFQSTSSRLLCFTTAYSMGNAETIPISRIESLDSSTRIRGSFLHLQK